jgi:hypothetical protein
MKRLFTIALSAMLLVCILTAYESGAAIIVDTGQPTNQAAFYSNGNQSRFASEFSVSQDWAVTSASAWIVNTGGEGDTLVIAIHNAGAGVPGTLLYSQAFTGPSGSDSGWYGSTGLNWALTANTTYWVVVSAYDQAANRFVVGGMGEYAPNGLVNDAMWNGNSWADYDQVNFGWQINGTPVPVPAAAWLLGSGLIGLAALRRTRSRG